MCDRGSIRAVRRLLALGTVACLLTGGACGGGRLRRPREVKEKDARRVCELLADQDLSRRQALCVAELAGLQVAAEGLIVREGQSLGKQAIWILEEPCGKANPDCLGLSIRKADGRIVNTRFLFIRERYPPRESSGTNRSGGTR